MVCWKAFSIKAEMFSWLSWRQHPVLTGGGWLSATHTCVTFLARQCNPPVFSMHCVKLEGLVFLHRTWIRFQGFQYLYHIGTKSWMTLWWHAAQGKTEEHWCLSRELNVNEVAPILPHEFFQEIGCIVPPYSQEQKECCCPCLLIINI